jgi:hypothetical protein
MMCLVVVACQAAFSIDIDLDRQTTKIDGIEPLSSKQIKIPSISTKHALTALQNNSD